MTTIRERLRDDAGCVAGLVAAAIITVVVGSYGYSILSRMRAHTTEARMITLMNYLLADRTVGADESSIATLLRKYGLRQTDRIDGWGHPFIFEAWKDKTRNFNHYRITALGRSGRRGACCTAYVDHDWSRNAVMQDFEWLQHWGF
jgi:hypothetical protein